MGHHVAEHGPRRTSQSVNRIMAILDTSIYASDDGWSTGLSIISTEVEFGCRTVAVELDNGVLLIAALSSGPRLRVPECDYELWSLLLRSITARYKGMCTYGFWWRKGHAAIKVYSQKVIDDEWERGFRPIRPSDPLTIR